jgi:predicted nucleic acid-binding protein
VAVVKDVFFDTSVLLAGLIDLGPPSRAAVPLLDAVARGRIRKPRTAWHCCLELYSVATRLPEEFRLAPGDAVTLIEEEILGRFEVHDLPARSRRGFLRLCGREGVRGGRLYDAHIAEIARSARAGIVVTENQRDFAVLERHGIPVVDGVGLLERLRSRRRGR